MDSKHSNKNGFTLIELLVVIAVIGLLATLGFAALNSSRQKARDAKRKHDLDQIGTALEMYWDKYGQYPSEVCTDSSIGNDNCGCGACGTAPGSCTGNDWCYTGASLIGRKLRDNGFLQNLPIDPTNNTTYYYSYEPDCNQGLCPSPKGCCYYTLWTRLEGGGTLTVTGGPN